jgi:hypothetical protein
MEASNHRRMEVVAASKKYPDEVRERAIRLVRNLVHSGEDGLTVTGARLCRSQPVSVALGPVQVQGGRSMRQ